MRVAIVHYWLVNWRGGEKVLKAIADIFPQADIFTHVMDPELVDRELPGRKVSTTFIARMPFARRLYQYYLPFMPLALEQLDLSEYDLVISSESGPAKGIIIKSNALHICYCHTPMRYLWDMYHEYRAETNPMVRLLMSPLMHYLRIWDQLSAQRVDNYIANSRFVAKRIEKYYRRAADVIYPPIAVDDFDYSQNSEDFYLSVGQLVSYKRPQMLVDAFNTLGRRLVIIGEGEMLASLRKRAHSNVELLGKQPFEMVREYYARCRALVFPGVEDFGMVPLEAMASGKPVIAYAAGGALETVIEEKTGLFFRSPTVQSLCEAVERFESLEGTFDRPSIREHAVQFSAASFRSRLSAHVDKQISATLCHNPAMTLGSTEK